MMDLAGQDNPMYIPDEVLSFASVAASFQKMSEECYTSFQGTISCGNMSSQVFVSPAPLVSSHYFQYQLTSSFFMYDVCSTIQMI